MRIPEKVVQDILQKIRIEDVVSDYVSLTRKGDRLWGLSPFKTEKTPSFSISPDKNAYYCFATQQGGGVAQFVMEMEKVSYPEALAILAKKLGIDISAEDGTVSEEYKQKKALIELYQRLTQTFHHMLTQTEPGKSAHSYLADRGLEDKTLDAFAIGWSPADPYWLHKFLISKGYSESFLAQSGLFSKKNKQWCIFAGRVMFPIRNITGETIAFGGRILDGDGPKYINSPETPIFHKGSNLFALDKAKEAIKEHAETILCEGYMDAIALHVAGIRYAVAPLGTAFTIEQAQILKRFSSRLTLLLDRDDAGIRATMKHLIVGEQAEFECSVIELPEGAKDPADILKESGSHALEKMVQYRLNAFEYMLKRTSRTASLASPEGKEKVVQGFLPYLSSIQSAVKQDASLVMLADVMGIPVETVREDFKRRLSKDSARKTGDERVSNHANRPATQHNPQYRLDLSIMLATFLNGELFTFVRSAIQIEDLAHPMAQELFIAMEESYRAEEIDFEHNIERIHNADLKQLLLQKRVDGEFSVNAELLVKDGIRRIKARNLEKRMDFVEYELRRLKLENRDDTSAERELLEEKIIIDEALKELRTHIDDRSAE